jgi:hypothetical protein
MPFGRTQTARAILAALSSVLAVHLVQFQLVPNHKEDKLNLRQFEMLEFSFTSTES